MASPVIYSFVSARQIRHTCLVLSWVRGVWCTSAKQQRAGHANVKTRNMSKLENLVVTPSSANHNLEHRLLLRGAIVNRTKYC